MIRIIVIYDLDIVVIYSSQFVLSSTNSYRDLVDHAALGEYKACRVLKAELGWFLCQYRCMYGPVYLTMPPIIGITTVAVAHSSFHQTHAMEDCDYMHPPPACFLIRTERNMNRS